MRDPRLASLMYVGRIYSRATWSLIIGLMLLSAGGCGELVSIGSEQANNVVDIALKESVETRLERPNSSAGRIPDWAVDAIFYQIFPERFANGDPSNDPTHGSLEFPESIPESWSVSPWTGDWYARAEWEHALGENFFEHGVFHRRYGGDLQGVIDKLDYIFELGVNAIYFNPVFYARSLHKYDGNTFHHIDPHFGPDPVGDFALMAQETSDPDTWNWTAADKLFLELVSQAHDRGIRIVIDGVFNHTGRDFFAFAHLRRHQVESSYKDWYIVQAFDNPDTPHNEFRYRGWWGVHTLPEFANSEDGNDLHPGPKAYVFDITRRWMDPNGDGDPSDGIDGWRLDVANEVPIGFWQEWTDLVRRINPDTYTVSEIWDDAHQYLRDCGFSATMNYHGFAYPVKGFLIDGGMAATDFAGALDARRGDYLPVERRALQNLIDSHDTDRLASMIVNAGHEPYLQPHRFDYDVGERVSPRHWPMYNVRKPTEQERRVQRLVVLFQMTYVGAPMVYYGSEAGMWGADDPCDRMPMVWPEFSYESQASDPLGREHVPDPVAFDHALHSYYVAAINLRRQLTALRRGTLEFIENNDKRQFVGFKRKDSQSQLLVGMNRGADAYTWDIELPDGKSVRQIFTASGDVSQHTIQTAPAGASVNVPALDGVVLLLE